MKKYSFKELKKEIVGKLKLGMAEYGFAYKGNGMDFERIMRGVRWSFRLGFIKHTSDFDVIASIAVGIDALENLIYEDEPSFLPGYSLGAELGNISEGKQRRWNICTEEDIGPVSISILKTFLDVGLPYLERYSVMKNALEAFSGDDRSAWLHSPFHDERAKRAIALAFLLRDHDAFSKLADKKTEFLTNRQDPMLGKFLDFRHKLESRMT
jgi:hypothetical protein